MKRVLIIGYVWPEPRSSAAGSRMMQLIELLRDANREVIFASAAALSDHRADLSALAVREQTIALNCDSFDTFVARLNPDIVLFDRFFTEEQFGWRVERTCPDASRVLDTSDLHSLRHARHRLLRASQHNSTGLTGNDSAGRNTAERTGLEQKSGPVTASTAELFTAMADDDMAQREVAAIYRCDLSLVISEFEIQLLQQTFGVPEMLLHYTPLMPELNPAAFASGTPLEPSAVGDAFSQREHFVSIGNFRHEPNWDAVLWLKHAIWPEIRRRLPRTQLHIYGSYPPPKATALHNSAQGFLINGWAEDAHQVISRARVCLAPLRFGAGIKGKLIDAMICGTPSVTTPIGSEGMQGNEPWGGAIAVSGAEFVEHAVALYEDQRRWEQARADGWNILRQRFNRRVHGDALLARLDEAIVRRESDRQKNFVGSMLRHHLHKSTQYMSQWIAAKNRTDGS